MKDMTIRSDDLIQIMSNAPRDGTRILVRTMDDKVVVVQWNASAALWCVGPAWNADGYGTAELRYWSPLGKK